MNLDFIINHAKKQDVLTDLSVFDPSKSNSTKSTKFTVDKKVRDTQFIDLEQISGEIVDLYRNIVSNVINPFYEVEIKDSEIKTMRSNLQSKVVSSLSSRSAHWAIVSP